MTKSTITRERLEEIVSDPMINQGSEFAMMARMALAAMDSEPVAWLLSGGGAKNVVCFDSGNAYADPLRDVTPLYRHQQPAPVVPEDVRQALSKMDDEIIAELDAEESACRAAMLNGGKS
ncbi:hypothetical protein [Klebsiella pneumoniae]|uniref:hypothetical protein n=1 Tax=Klebsiella pneumoniae TaxID=573 RepID=UPI0007CBAE9F|nr:hypothetical protein [Klebsiella pneumoniae]SAT61998.1 Uncharacterised protein [Klebsiella pneumoniae]